MELITLLSIYLLAGITLLATLLIRQYLINKPSNLAKEVLNALQPREKVFKEYFLEYLAYVIAIAALLTGWPIFIGWMMFESYKDGGWVGKLLGNEKQELEDYIFNCHPENLICELTPCDAEKEGCIYDPLSSTPSIPFGYLHNAWIQFLSNQGEDESLWKFEINPTNQTYRHKRYSGYAWVKDGKVMDEFLIEC